MTDFADDVVEELLSRTEKGEPLTRICADKRMPKRRTVYDWLESDEQFAAQFRAARARGVHALAEECLEIADKAAKDPVEVADKRVRIDTRLRLAGKWLPTVYGEKIQQEHTITDKRAADMTEEELLGIAAGGRTGTAEAPSGPH